LQNFYVAARYNLQRYTDVASNGDTVKYQFDFTGWQDDNDVITGVTWKVESGQASLGANTLVAGVASTLVSFIQPGRSLISGVATTASGITKKVWLALRCYDENLVFDDYWGYYTGSGV